MSDRKKGVQVGGRKKKRENPTIGIGETRDTMRGGKKGSEKKRKDLG